jgi:2-oxoglutarate/2-oxoacid ferredoxin oxidoreductase subunit beta
MCTGCHVNYNYENSNVKISDFNSEVQPTWCSGCGDYGIWAALKRALADLELRPYDVLLCFDIGCNGNMSDKIRGYRIHSLHGRVLPIASAAKIANPDVKVIAFAGDGATYSEGMSHFINSIRSNYPITFIVHNNGNYGLTKGQASATTPQKAPREGSPDGPLGSTINPLDLAFALNPSFVARGFSGDIKQMVEIFKDAILFQDKGFAYVDVLQACPTYNKETTHDWYIKRVFDIKSIENYKVNDLTSARQISADLENKIATGVLYKNESNPTFLQRLEYRKISWANSNPVKEVRKYDITQMLKEFV